MRDKKPKKITAKKVTQGYLERAAVFYLERYSSSRKNLERVLDRKVRRRHEDGAAPSEEERDWIKCAADKCAQLGYVDDSRYASQKALTMHTSGKSIRSIKMYLYSKGLGEDDIKAAIESLQDEKGEDTELKAAIIYARKRGFGPFRLREADDARMQKDIASMMRAGHQINHVMKVLKAEGKEELEDILYA